MILECWITHVGQCHLLETVLLRLQLSSVVSQLATVARTYTHLLLCIGAVVTHVHTHLLLCIGAVVTHVHTHLLLCIGAVVTERVITELGNAVGLSCPEGGMWSRDGHTLTTDTPNSLIKDGLLFIYSAQISDAGEYWCAGQLTYLLITGNY